MSNKLEELIKVFRSGQTRIDLDRAELLRPDSAPIALGVPAFVTINERRLRLHLRDSEPVKLSPLLLSVFARDVSEKVITSSGHLVIESLTDQGVPVRLEGVSPCFSNEQSHFVNRGGSVTHREILFDRLSILPMGSEGLTVAERRAENIAAGVIKADQPSGWPEDEEESFFALIPSVKLRLLNSGVSKTTKHPYHRHDGFSGNTSCYTGKILNGEFCLEQTDTGDLSISYRRNSRSAESAPPIKAISEAFMAAIGLLHSCNPWPFYYSQSHERRLVTRWVKAPPDCERDSLEPLHVSIRDENAEHFFAQAVGFFATGGEDAEYYRKALWLMREACRKRAPLEVRLITLCSVLEGVAKRSLGAARLDSLDKWKEAVNAAGLPWDDWFEEVRQSYFDYRNKLAHGFDPHPADEQSPALVFKAYSRISAGIYILMAKRMGFTGTLWRSRLEGGQLIALSGS